MAAFRSILLAGTTLLPAVGAQVGVAPGPPPKADAIQWDYYPISVHGGAASLLVETELLFGPGIDLYLRHGRRPTETVFDFVAAHPGSVNETLLVDGSTHPQLSNGTWWAGVRHSKEINYDISWSFGSAPSAHPGLGANVYADRPTSSRGTSFRVWAPFATNVWLTGDFNSWSSTSAAMHPESNGYWSLDVRDLQHGAHYRYVINGPSGLHWKNDPRARRVTSSVGNSVVVDPADFDWGQGSFSMPAWNEIVLYELHIGTFDDDPGGGPGDFTRAISRLDDLVDLGINAVEVMPVCEFPLDFSWGYNYSHPFAVESAYGGDEGFKTFIKEAHARGIAVLTDVLYNHWGPNDMDLWQFDGWHQGGYGGIYFYNNPQAVTAWGDTRPDYGRPEVREYIRDNSLYWLNEFQLDGMRWDSTSTIRQGPFGEIPEGWSLMQWANDSIDASHPWKLIVAEDMYNAPNEWITKPTGAGGTGFDGQWDAMFVHPIRGVMIAPNDADRNMWTVRDAVSLAYNGDAFERVIYTESHDEVANGKSRLPEEIWPGNASSWFSKKRSTLAAAILMTSPGIPMLFQGQEILEDGHFADEDPVDWSKSQTFAGIRLLYRDLIHLRRNWYDSTRGLRGQHTNVSHVNDFDKVIAYHRWDQGGPRDDVVVVCNLANQGWGDYRVGLPRTGLWKVRFNSDWAGYDASYGDHPSFDAQAEAIPWDGMPFSASLSFGPYTALILSQD